MLATGNRTKQQNFLRRLRRRARRASRAATGLGAEHAQLVALQRQVEKLKAADVEHRRTERQQARQLEKMAAAVKATEGKLRPLARLGSIRTAEHTRHGMGISALELRMGRLEGTVADGPLTHDADGLTAARDVLDAVRLEHEQIRIRLQIVAQYEERLRRVELAVELYDDSTDVKRII